MVKSQNNKNLKDISGENVATQINRGNDVYACFELFKDGFT